MRSQYGSQYPASFFRLDEAYDLKRQIDRQDKERESYYINYNASKVSESSLDKQAMKGPAPGVIGVHRAVDKKDGKELSDADKKAADKKKVEQTTSEGAANASATSAIATKKQKDIKAKISEREKRTHAQGGLAAWQRRMEAIQIRAGKHNIVNNYVWDADGGMRTEAQSFANTAEHTVGGSFSGLWHVGFTGEYEAEGAAGELKAEATIKLTQTMSKTQSHTNGFGLEVDVSGVESSGVTDHDDYPIMPGQKVDRYRFMSFYLEGSTRNFKDFFNYVVDPEWLASNDEEARALRQANGKANKTWRVLHRVTYVERPALMGFGRDLRSLHSPPDRPSEVKKLNKRIGDLEGKLNKILDLLEKKGEDQKE